MLHGPTASARQALAHHPARPAVFLFSRVARKPPSNFFISFMHRYVIWLLCSSTSPHGLGAWPFHANHIALALVAHMHDTPWPAIPLPQHPTSVSALFTQKSRRTPTITSWLAHWHTRVALSHLPARVAGPHQPLGWSCPFLDNHWPPSYSCMSTLPHARCCPW